jgi:hypothetical protein
MVQVRNHLASQRDIATDRALLENFPAVLQALTARALEVSALSESFVADLADALTAATIAGQDTEEDLAEFKVPRLCDMSSMAALQGCAI